MDYHANFVYGLIKTAPSPATSGTSLVLNKSSYGDIFPDPASTGAYNVTIWPASTQPTTANAEIVRVTAKSDNGGANETTLTITRTQESTSARTIIAGDQISMNITKKVLVDIENMAVSAQVKNEVPGGSVNSSNTAFTTASAFQTGSLRVYLNGIRLKGGGTDFTEGTQGFTMTVAPTTGGILLVDYDTNTSVYATGSTSFIYNELVNETPNGSTTAFTIDFTPVAGTEQVYLNGQLQQVGAGNDYTISTNTITFLTAPLTGSVILVTYQKSVSTAGNADTLDGLHAPSAASTAIVGTKDTQTLENKTFTSPKINENVAIAATATKIDGVCNTYIPWTAYVPTITAPGGTAPTYPDIQTGKYCQIGKKVTLQFYLYQASGGTAGAGAVNLYFSLPVTAADTCSTDWQVICGNCLVHNGTPTSTTKQVVVYSSTTGAFLDDSTAFLKASGQNSTTYRILIVNMTYEAA